MTQSNAETQPENQLRATYEKPQITKVLLVPEEAVLAACKWRDGLINAWESGQCGWLFQCYGEGS